MLEIKKNNQTIYLRNLQEQVQKNKEDIAKHYSTDKVLAEFGIKVLGRFDTYEEIENFDEGENYGNAYLIGAEPPYNVYVWTRPDENAGQPVAYWLNIGPVSIVGPEGPAGKDGEKGETGQSTQWYSGRSTGSVQNPKVGDMFLNTQNGAVYRYQFVSAFNAGWIIQGSIMGPQGLNGANGLEGPPGPEGPQGPKGERGDVGGFINIWGILTSADQLPTPMSLDNLTVAYLVEHTGGSDAANDHYDLYIQVGETSDVAIWENVGPFNAATLITVNGEGQNVWNADTKLDADTHVTEYNQVYVKAANGGQGHINVTKQTVNDAVVQRQSDGHILVPTQPASGEDAASKYYVDETVNGMGAWLNQYIDEGFQPKPETFTSGRDRLIAYGPNDQIREIQIASSALATGYAIPRADSAGRIRVATPQHDDDAVNKAYADTQLATKVGFEDYATADKAGVIKVNVNSSGFNLLSGGSLVIHPASSSVINGRNQTGIDYSARYAITYGNLNEAVIAALTDAKKIQLSDEQKTSACEALGALKAVTDTTTWTQVYGKGTTGTQQMFNVHGNANPYTIPQRQANGVLKVGNPVEAKDAVNLEYLQGVIASLQAQIDELKQQ